MFSYNKLKCIRATVFFCSMIGCISVNAQFSIGIEGGLNKNYLITNNANRAFTNYGPLYGFSVGVPVQYKVNDWLVIAADPSFIQKNYRQERSDFFAGIYQQNNNGYITLPLMGHFLFGGSRLKGFAEAGLYGAYWTAGQIKGNMPDILDNGTGNGTNSLSDYDNSYKYNEKYQFDSRRDNRFEAGWVGGLGLSYALYNRFQVFIAGRIMYDFTDQQKNYMINQTPRYNTTYSMNGGVMMQLPRKKTITTFKPSV